MFADGAGPGRVGPARPHRLTGGDCPGSCRLCPYQANTKARCTSALITACCIGRARGVYRPPESRVQPGPGPSDLDRAVPRHCNWHCDRGDRYEAILSFIAAVSNGPL